MQFLENIFRTLLNVTILPWPFHKIYLFPLQHCWQIRVDQWELGWLQWDCSIEVSRQLPRGVLRSICPGISNGMCHSSGILTKKIMKSKKWLSIFYLNAMKMLNTKLVFNIFMALRYEFVNKMYPTKDSVQWIQGQFFRSVCTVISDIDTAVIKRDRFY